MDKYTCKNLVIDPETQGLEDIIGKEVYYHNTPLLCLYYANEDCCIGTLKEIRKDDFCPFRVETPGEDILSYACIIPKREEPKPKYVPFESRDEFIDAYDRVNYSIKNGTIENKLLNYGGIWLKGKITRSCYMVTEIWNNGVILAGSRSMIFWDGLLEDYVLLDGSPCGKLKETE